MSMWISAAKMLHRVGVPFPYLNLIACGSSNVLTRSSRGYRALQLGLLVLSSGFRRQGRHR